MLGVSSLVMGWNIGYLHDPSLMVIEEVGTFKEVPLHPTLFVGADELSLDYGQARPVGLMYASNALSIFVAIAVAVNVAIERTSRIGFSDFVVTVLIGLTMSKLVFVVTIVLYLGVLVFGSKQRKILVLKLTVGLAVIMYLYYVLFPGLFMNNLSIGMIMIAVMLRLMDLMTAAGIEIYFDELADLAYVYRPSHVYEIEEGYSFVATLLRSSVSIPWLFLLTIGSILYMYRIGRMSPRPVMVYMVTLTACIMTQFAIPFVKAASFQLILGFALFPLFPRISSAKG
jgi:hypothetical protein